LGLTFWGMSEPVIRTFSSDADLRFCSDFDSFFVSFLPVDSRMGINHLKVPLEHNPRIPSLDSMMKAQKLATPNEP